LNKNISVSEQLKNPSILAKNTEQKKILKELNKEISDFAKDSVIGDFSLIKDINSLFSGVKTASESMLQQSARVQHQAPDTKLDVPQESGETVKLSRYEELKKKALLVGKKQFNKSNSDTSS
jgi:hypothetical protein